MPRLQLWHLLVLLLVILLVFGANRLPDIARNLGKSAKVLKEEVKDLRDDEPTPPSGQAGAAQQPYQQPPNQAQQPYQPQQQPYQAPQPPSGPYSPGGAVPPGVDSPTAQPPGSSAAPTEWPPGSSPR